VAEAPVTPSPQPIIKTTDKEAFVWIWLPDAKEPELRLKPGVLPLLDGLTMPGCIRDSAPDAWGRRVIINKKLGSKGKDSDTDPLGELTYLLESGSDRIGALDFQRSPSEYVPRSANNVPLEELLQSAARVEQGVPLTPERDQALFHGSSIGGARPKALIEYQGRGEDQGTKYVAKFSSRTDLYSVVKAEYIAMQLAALAGINVAHVKLLQAAQKDVLLIERFDREKTTQAMLISGDNRLSKLKSCLDAAPHFQLTESEAKVVFEKQREAIESNWNKVCDEANLSVVDRKLFWKRQFLNAFAFED